MEYSKINRQIRLCAWETPSGNRRPYLCNHHEYCCAVGCCVSSTFSFYQLWYFWLLLLLIILLCSGGGWWYRFRHGGWSHQGTPIPGRGRRHARRRGAHGDNSGQRVFPQYNYDNYNLPPGYDKDPPSYNEVISHLSQFPRIQDMGPPGSGPSPSNSSTGSSTGVSNTGGPNPPEPTAGGSSALEPSAPSLLEGSTDCHISLPPPSYEMVLDLKRRDMTMQQNLEVEEEEEEGGDETANMRDRIRNLLGRVRAGRGMVEHPPQPRQAYGPEASSSGTSSVSSGLFTISGESLSSPQYHQQAPPPDQDNPPSFGSLIPPSVDSESSSHSDYSSSFLSSPSSVTRSLLLSPSQTPTEAEAPPSPNPGDSPPPEAVGVSRPCTGRSTLSRPTTSISTRTLPPPPQLARKTSLPGTVLEVEDDRVDR